MRVLEGKQAAEACRGIAARSATSDRKVERTVQRIIDEVRRKGEPAVRRYAEKLDGLKEGQPLRVTALEMRAALGAVSPAFLDAVKEAAANIRKFAEWQKPKSWMRTIRPGVRVGQEVVPLSRVGCYVPGGRYPLPSSLLMTVVPAQVAGVTKISVASPSPAVETLAAAALIGVRDFYRIGGAQAIASFAYGVESKDSPIARVDKIVGPGNAYVTAAKKSVAFDSAIDMLAGPTEAVVLAHDGDGRFYAADLVAQAEHDPEALVIFISSNRKLARDVVRECSAMTKRNPIAREALERNAVALLASTKEQALGWATAIACEHATVPRGDEKRIFQAGSVFVGQYSPQSLGDYVAGPNHTLPTGGAARHRGGLSVLDFVKIITVQEVTRFGLKKIGPTAVTLAEAEGLKAHADSVRVRLQ